MNDGEAKAILNISKNKLFIRLLFWAYFDDVTFEETESMENDSNTVEKNVIGNFHGALDNCY